MTATTLSDAAKECSDNTDCHRFYDDGGYGNNFLGCGTKASIDESLMNSVLYYRQGNKLYTQF